MSYTEEERKLRHAARERLRRSNLLNEHRCKGCGVTLPDGYTKRSCETCLVASREERLRVLAAGLCEKCYEPRGAEGTQVRCRACADKDKNHHTKRRKHRKAQHVCAQCSNPLTEVDGNTFCRTCLNSHYERLNTNYTSKGLCKNCGKHPIELGRTTYLCTTCADKRAQEKLAKYYQRKDAGVCTRCGKPIIDGAGLTECVNCSERPFTFKWT